MPVVRSLQLPGLLVEYDRVLGQADGYAVTRRGALGVAFTGQEHAVWAWARGPSIRGPYAPRSVFVTGDRDIVWREWGRASEAVEIWLEPPLFERVSERAMEFPGFNSTVVQDPLIVATAAQFRRALLQDDRQHAALETSALTLAEHVLRHYAGLQTHFRQRVSRLSSRELVRVHEYITEHLHENPSLSELAGIVAMSPLHFAKRFKATTGIAPHAYIIARRMDLAMELLCASRLSIAQLAARVGYSNPAHFRAQFRTHWGRSPGLVRRAS
jgi:AraC family transcriptional regulator